MNKLLVHEATTQKGSLILFFIQMFTTLSYGVLFSGLIFYLTNNLKMADKMATDITASFVALSFFLNLLGGWIGGKLLSFRTLLIIAIVLQLAGLLLISTINLELLYWGLAVFLTGNGFNLTCINYLLTQLFAPEDKRREKAFLWNYSARNIGYIMGYALAGYFLLTGNYSRLFILSAFATIFSLSIVFLGWSKLKDTQVLPHNTKPYVNTILVAVFFGALVLMLEWLLQHTHYSNLLMITAAALTLLYIVYLGIKQVEQDVRQKIMGYVILSIAALCFNTIAQLAPTGLNLFFARNVNLHVVGVVVTPQWLLIINSLVCIAGGPLLANFFQKLRLKGYMVSIPAQFTVAMLIMGISMMILPLGILFADMNGLSNVSWSMVSVGMQGLAEVLFVPIGYAMVGQLAPPASRGLFMGYWVTCLGLGAIFAGYFSKFALGTINAANPLITNSSYSHTFNFLGWTTIIFGLAVLSLSPFLKRLINSNTG